MMRLLEFALPESFTSDKIIFKGESECHIRWLFYCNGKYAISKFWRKYDGMMVGRCQEESLLVKRVFMLVSHLSSLLNSQLTARKVKQVHALIIVSGFWDLEPIFIRRLVSSTRSLSPSFYRYMQSILKHLSKTDNSFCSCTIRSFAQSGQFKEAVTLYVQMQRAGLCPSEYTVSSVLRACARIQHELFGLSIHAQVHKNETCQSVYVQTALLDFYSKVGDVETARKVFDHIDEKNVVSWNSMLAGYLKHGELSSAEQLFNQIPERDTVSWNSMISGYARSGDMDKAYSLFQQIPVKNLASWNAMISGYINCCKLDVAQSFFDKMPERNSVSWITMISGYSKHGDVKSAKKLFNSMPSKDQLSFNSMITCYAHNSQGKEAITLFKEMLQSNLNTKPDKMTLASVISACSQLGDMSFGSWIETYIKRRGIEMDDHLLTAFIDLYAKCGDINKAYQMFNTLGKKDVVAYTAMILGFGVNGKATDTINLFKEMLEAQISPNLITYSGILTAYSHCGLVKEGYECFESMKNHKLGPTADHYAIMVELLGRAGRLDEAYGLIKSMPMDPHGGVWGALLLACKMHNNVELAEVAAQHCFELEPDRTGYSTSLASIYESNGRWDDSKRLRKSVMYEGSHKVPGCSWIESCSTLTRAVT
ncbi:hypothetical protein V2J09_014714 [Rumex salicifolius]